MDTTNVRFDVVIVGGGPAGHSAALALGRARKRVLLCDSGPRRNAAAVHMHNFVTRDGTPPEQFRSLAREQLSRYPNVAVRDTAVTSVSGARGAFRVALGSEQVSAGRVLLCTGMLDEMVPLEGFRELWGRSIFQCPYCHGWEVQDRRWGYLALEASPHLLPFVLQMRSWSGDVIVFTRDAFELPDDVRSRFAALDIRVETAPVARLVKDGGGGLAAVELGGGARVPRDVLFAHPRQRQVDLVSALGVQLDEDGYVRLDPQKRETSVPGIFAAGDLTTRQQAAILASASGMQAALAINVDLMLELSAGS